MSYDFHLEQVGWPKVSAVHENVVHFGVRYIFERIVDDLEKWMGHQRFRIESLARIYSKASPQQVIQVCRNLLCYLWDLSLPVTVPYFKVELFFALD